MLAVTHHRLLLALALSGGGLALIALSPGAIIALAGTAVFWSGVLIWFATRLARRPR